MRDGEGGASRNDMHFVRDMRFARDIAFGGDMRSAHWWGGPLSPAKRELPPKGSHYNAKLSVCPSRYTCALCAWHPRIPLYRGG